MMPWIGRVFNHPRVNGNFHNTDYQIQSIYFDGYKKDKHAASKLTVSTNFITEIYSQSIEQTWTCFISGYVSRLPAFQMNCMINSLLVGTWVLIKLRNSSSKLAKGVWFIFYYPQLFLFKFIFILRYSIVSQIEFPIQYLKCIIQKKI